jgi:lysophospholipase L1-like esterase
MESDPDIAILMLGMNDANPTHHFNEENGGPISEYYIELYQKLLTEIIEGLKDLESKPEIFLVKTTEMKRTVEQGFSVNYVTDFLENLKKIRDIQEFIIRPAILNRKTSGIWSLLNLFLKKISGVCSSRMHLRRN